MSAPRKLSEIIRGGPFGETMAHADIVRGVYQGLLGRAADPAGLQNYLDAMKHGMPLHAAIAAVVNSEEFASRHGSLPAIGRYGKTCITAIMRRPQL
jgi:hypothetical protein